MNKTNFQKVQEFNRAFDMAPQHPVRYLSYKDINIVVNNKYLNSLIHMRPQLFVDSQHIIKLRLALIDEEIKELNKAIYDNDIIETRDALSDILYVTYGIADVLGINIDSFFSAYFIKTCSDKTIYKDYMKIQNITNMNLFANIDNKCTYCKNMDNNIQCVCNCVLNDNSCNYTKILNLNNFNKTQILNDCTRVHYSIQDTISSVCEYEYDNMVSTQVTIQTMQTNINNNYKELEKYCTTGYYASINTDNDEDKNAYKERSECVDKPKPYGYDIEDNYTMFENTQHTHKFNIISNYINNILYWVYSYTYKLGYNADTDFSIVHNSNMSKLCDTIVDAQNTVNDYINKFNLGKSPYDTPYYYELPALNKWIVKNKSTGKALKNIKYCKVIFS